MQGPLCLEQIVGFANQKELFEESFLTCKDNSTPLTEWPLHHQRRERTQVPPGQVRDVTSYS